MGVLSGLQRKVSIVFKRGGKSPGASLGSE